MLSLRGEKSEQLTEADIGPDFWSVGHEAPGLDKIAAWEGSGEPRAARKRGDAHAVGGNESIVHDVKCKGRCSLASIRISSPPRPRLKRTAT